MDEEVERLRREIANALIEMRSLVLAATLLALADNETSQEESAGDFRDADQRLRACIYALDQEAGSE